MRKRQLGNELYCLIGVFCRKLGIIYEKKLVFKGVIIVVVLAAFYFLYFNFYWIIQINERKNNMVTEYYPKGSIHYNIATANYVAARIQILFGTDVNQIDRKRDETPLETSLSSMGNPDIFIRMLVRNGADLNLKSHRILYQYISYYGDNLKMIQFLVDKGADVNDGSLTVASEMNNYNAVKLLVEKGVKINQKDERGRTALMKACFTDTFEEVPRINTKEQFKIIKYLLDKGAIPSEKDNDGKTAYDYINKYKNKIEKMDGGKNQYKYTDSVLKILNEKDQAVKLK